MAEQLKHSTLAADNIENFECLNSEELLNLRMHSTSEKIQDGFCDISCEVCIGDLPLGNNTQGCFTDEQIKSKLAEFDTSTSSKKQPVIPDLSVDVQLGDPNTNMKDIYECEMLRSFSESFKMEEFSDHHPYYLSDTDSLNILPEQVKLSDFDLETISNSDVLTTQEQISDLEVDIGAVNTVSLESSVVSPLDVPHLGSWSSHHTDSEGILKTSQEDRGKTRLENSEKHKCANLKVKQSGCLNMMVTEAEHSDDHLSQSNVMSSIEDALRKCGEQSDRLPRTESTGEVEGFLYEKDSGVITDNNYSSGEVDKSHNLHEISVKIDEVDKMNIGKPETKSKIKMSSVARMQLVNLEFPLYMNKNVISKHVPYLHMKVMEPFDAIETRTQSTIVGVIHSLVGHGQGSKEIGAAYTCQDCGAGFDLRHDWRVHTRSHSEGPPNQCSICHKTFKNENSLRFHKRRHVEGAISKSHACESCGKLFYSRSAASEHARVHTGERPYECPVCGRRFIRKFTMKQHTHIHLSERPRPYQCSLCGDRFYRKHCLDQKGHCKKHTDGHKFTCRDCGQAFSSLGQVLCHRKSHKAVRGAANTVAAPVPLQRHVCVMCGKVFGSAFAWKAHTRVHLGEPPYKCGECGKGFRSKRSKDVHVKKKLCGVKSTELASAVAGVFQGLPNEVKLHMDTHGKALLAAAEMSSQSEDNPCHRCGESFGSEENVKLHHCPKVLVTEVPAQVEDINYFTSFTNSIVEST